MSKKLKLFGLLALTVALAAGVAWAEFPLHILAGPDVGDREFKDTLLVATNMPITPGTFVTLTGDGTLLGKLYNNIDKFKVLNVDAGAGRSVTVAPGLSKRVEAITDKDHEFQVIVNRNGGGVVTFKGSNNNGPTKDVYTLYHGGTVQFGGTFVVTENNALGQRWIGVRGASTAAAAPVFQSGANDKVQFGNGNDPAGNPLYQPFLLSTHNEGALQYVKVNADAPVVNSSSQGLWLHDGLDQRTDFTADATALVGGLKSGGQGVKDEPFKVAERRDGEFVRLIKEGQGTLFINGDSDELKDDAAAQALKSAWGAGNDVDGYAPVDGAHHYGGTDVVKGVLEIHAGNATVLGDHFRGSLGKVWSKFQGSMSEMVTPYDPESFLTASRLTRDADNNIIDGAYNPLFIRNDAQVKVNRSQFFSDFNTDSATLFDANLYVLNSRVYHPQIAVTLDQNDSRAEGTMKGYFDLVLHSIRVGGANGRPTQGHPQNSAITHDSMAVLHVMKPVNQIVSGDTLISNGVLEIAGARSLGPDQVTIGAAGDRGFQTRWIKDVDPTKPDLGGVATLAVTDTFMLDNATVGQALGAVAVDDGKVLTFKDIELQNLGTQEQDTFRINPECVRLGTNYSTIKNIGGTEPFFTNKLGTDKNRLSDKWRGTVVFGSTSGDAEYKIAGTKFRQTRIDVERGVLQLNAFPTKTADQVSRNENPYAIVYLWPKSVLSLAKDMNNFGPHLNVKVTRDSRIRVVLRSSDIVPTLDNARAKDAVFVADHIDYRGLGDGEGNRDRRLVIQIDPSNLPSQTVSQGWVKLVYSLSGEGWENTHFLREDSTGHKEDFNKVEVSWIGAADLPIKGAKVYVDQEQYTVYVNFTEAINNPVDPGKPEPQPEKKPDGPEISAPSTAEVSKPVTFTLGDWYFNEKKLAAGDVKDVVWMLDGKDVTTQVNGNKLEVTPTAEGTMTLEIKGKLVSDPTKELSQKKSVTVTKAGTTPTPTPEAGKSGGGCDAGFGALALALAAAFLLKKKA